MPSVLPTTQTVALLQARLGAALGRDVMIDGMAGPLTVQAIADFWESVGRKGRPARVDDPALLPALLPALTMDPHGDPGWGFHARFRGCAMHTPVERPVPGVSGYFLPVGILVHHTAGPADRQRIPFERMAKGRSDLSGPLCNFAVSRDGRADTITHGRAHHAGSGDGAVLADLNAGIDAGTRKPTSDGVSGNSFFYGIEVDHTGKVGEGIPVQQLNLAVRLCAVLCAAWGWDPFVRVLGHLEWTRRKNDPAFIQMEMFREEVAKAMQRNPLNHRPTGDVVCPCCGSTLVDHGEPHDR